MQREIVLDTETTGTDAKSGDRVIEIGCVELVNHIQTGRTFHCFINPQRPVSEGAFAVHGLSDAFLADKPVFAEIVDDFVAFCDGAKLVIHNAAFDVGFLNAEFSKLGPAGPSRIVLESVVDTLLLARRKHPGAGNSLDALCSRYGIDTSARTKHGALLDAQILAEVYIELLGGKQTSLGFGGRREITGNDVGHIRIEAAVDRIIPQARLTAEDQRRHAEFSVTLGKDVIWRDYATGVTESD